jgi:hypothetical protein
MFEGFRRHHEKKIWKINQLVQSNRWDDCFSNYSNWDISGESEIDNEK